MLNTHTPKTWVKILMNHFETQAHTGKHALWLAVNTQLEHWIFISIMKMQHERLKLWLFSIMYALFVWPLFASHAPKHSIRGITLAIRDWAVVRLFKT